MTSFIWEDVSVGNRARADDFLGIVAEEEQWLSIGRANLTVLLGDGIIDIVHGKGCIVDDLEAEPGEFPVVNGAHGALERGDIGHRQRGHDAIEGGRRHMRVTTRGVFAECRNILRGEDWRLPELQCLDCCKNRFLVHATSLNRIAMDILYF